MTSTAGRRMQVAQGYRVVPRDEGASAPSLAHDVRRAIAAAWSAEPELVDAFRTPDGVRVSWSLVEAGEAWVVLTGPVDASPVGTVARMARAERDLARVLAAVEPPVQVVPEAAPAAERHPRVRERHEAVLAEGDGLLAWRVGVTGLVLLSALAALVHLLVAASVLIAVVPLLPVLLRLQPRGPSRLPGVLAQLQRADRAFQRVLYRPIGVLLGVLVERVGWRRVRRRASAFLCTRALLAGEGDGAHGFAPSGAWLTGEVGPSGPGAARPLLDVDALLAHVARAGRARPAGLVSLWDPVQPLSLGAVHANRCEVAAVLKLGTTALVLDLVEAGVLDDAPRPRDPVAAARAVARHGAVAGIACEDGRRYTAVDLQRFYAARARAWLAAQPTPDLRRLRLAGRWTDALDAIVDDPDALVGQLDWAGVGFLQRGLGGLRGVEGTEVAARYRALGGYAAWMAEEGLMASWEASDPADAPGRVAPAPDPPTA